MVTFVVWVLAWKIKMAKSDKGHLLRVDKEFTRATLFLPHVVLSNDDNSTFQILN